MRIVCRRTQCQFEKGAISTLRHPPADTGGRKDWAAFDTEAPYLRRYFLSISRVDPTGSSKLSLAETISCPTKRF